LRILLVEDNPLDAELVAASLNDGGVSGSLRRVQTRDEFESALREGLSDLILADYNLPAFDGISALRIARTAVPEVPFLFVSGAIGEELAIATLREGATDYVLKHRLERLAPAVVRALREAEERAERRRAEQALQESEERFRLLVEGARDYAIFMLDPAGNVLSWNEGAERILGYPVAAALGRPFAALFPEDDVRAGRPASELRTAAEQGQAQQEGWWLRKGGSRFWASGVTSALRRPDGTLRGFACILRDLSDRKRLEEALRQRAEALAEAGRRKDEFLAVLSHELRNPLGPIRNALHILRIVAPGEPEELEAREVIDRQVRHLSRLVDDLLDVFRITHGKLLLRKERLDLARLVRLTVADHRKALETAGLRVAIEVPEQPVWAVGDTTRLAQVVGNLLANAGKFTDPGGEVCVCLSSDAGAAEALLTVRDTGIGIAPETLPHVFEIFAQGGNLTRARGGLGLGLALVRGLAELHGGRARAHSDGLGHGSELSVWLPLARAPAPAAGEDRPNGHGTKAVRVLIVEDNPDAARTLAILLRKLGHQVETAADGAAGVAAARRLRPDVVVCDLGLPELDGFEVARALRRDPDTASARLIALSGYAQEEDRRRCFEAGFDLHLTKPVDPDELQNELLAGTKDARPAAHEV
jgi:PAS domain S-box-containing protein